MSQNQRTTFASICAIRSRGEDAHVPVDGVRDEVRDGRVDDAAPRDVREVARPRCAEPLRHDAIEDEIEELAVRPAGFRERLDQGARELRAAFRVRGRLPGQRLDVVEHPLGRRLDERPELLAGELELPVELMDKKARDGIFPMTAGAFTGRN